MKVLRLTFLLVALDQATKLFIKGFTIFGWHMQGLTMYESHEVLGNFLRITYIENPGMAFGVDFGDTTKIFFSLFSLVASGAIFAYLYSVRNSSLMLRTSLALILAGAFGNFIDRAFYGILYGTAPFLHGSVVDFIDVDFFKINFLHFHLSRWPVFNVADACVSVGVVLLVVTFQFSQPKDAIQQPNSENSLPPDHTIPGEDHLLTDPPNAS
ncbi:MAG TPA: signal peptidase II [Candidatus Kapabacteria bacterium]|nr:signal peptidase II [Candidatus Kapabacteria bacterium]